MSLIKCISLFSSASVNSSDKMGQSSSMQRRTKYFVSASSNHCSSGIASLFTFSSVLTKIKKFYVYIQTIKAYAEKLELGQSIHNFQLGSCHIEIEAYIQWDTTHMFLRFQSCHFLFDGHEVCRGVCVE